MPALPNAPRARPGFRQVKGGGMARTEVTDRLMKGKEFLNMKNKLAMASEADMDVDIADTSRNHRGVGFRYLFALFMFMFIGGLMLLKLNGEFIRPPERSDTESEEQRKGDDALAEEFLKKMGEQREERSDDYFKQETDKQRHKRRKQEQAEVKKAYEDHKTKMKSGECDAECQANSKAIEILNDQVSSVVTFDYYKMFDIESGFGLSKEELRNKYKDLKEKVAAGDPEYDHFDLAELDESYSTLVNNDARMYYNMYGRKPPAHMKGNAAGARDGGVGVQVLSGKWKTLKLKAWMEHFDSEYVDLGVLALIGLFTILPVVYNFRTMMRTMKEAFPDLDPETADEHRDKQQMLRQSTYQRRRR